MGKINVFVLHWYERMTIFNGERVMYILQFYHSFILFWTILRQGLIYPQTYYIAKDNLELWSPCLYLPSKCLDYRHPSPGLVYVVLSIKMSTSWMLRHHFATELHPSPFTFAFVVTSTGDLTFYTWAKDFCNIKG